MKRLAAAVLFTSLFLVAAHASADAAVHVSVRSADQKPVDGTVTLAPTASGRSFSCSTRGGVCTMQAVPGGQYIVTFRPKAGSSPAPHKVMIPPEGKVDLRVSAK